MMGRKPSKPGSIPRFRVRTQKSGAVLYYYDHGGKPRHEEPLGRDYGLAIKRWAEIERESDIPAPAVLTFRWVAQQYMAAADGGLLERNKAPRTLADNRKEVAKLLTFFDDPPAPLEAIEPVNVRQYMTWRTKGGTARVRANRERALLSVIWNFARDKGYTAIANPCAGIKGFIESGRDAYIEQSDYAALWANADVVLRDAMDLAYLTGQRPGDVLRMAVTDLREGVLNVRQAKTGAKLRMAIEGELAGVIERIMARKAAHKIYSTRLIVNENGRPIGVNALSRRFNTARTAAGMTHLQFRDLRAKAATDKADSAGDVRQAQRQLGHSSVVMTEAYIRQRRGAKVTPTR